MTNVRDSVLLNSVSVKEKWGVDTTNPPNHENRNTAHKCSVSTLFLAGLSHCADAFYTDTHTHTHAQEIKYHSSLTWQLQQQSDSSSAASSPALTSPRLGAH